MKSLVIYYNEDSNISAVQLPSPYVLLARFLLIPAHNVGTKELLLPSSFLP
ncbi:MAG: hypothetical protein QF807_06575 [Candidatus Thalassarchaeaceae archaeon]|nr:hypothetical protein [Candidatus Thalassarchaeaceae archaeon]MDP7043662.1 hypothetical protein [Candidatus Thalassarchaeaceae archaeon]